MTTQIGHELLDTIIRFTAPHLRANEDDLMSRIANSPYPLLILGESGTGKELVARAIHLNGPNRNLLFLAIDCVSLLPSLIETELFGNAEGVFTGATGAKIGLLELAAGGTIFLDHVGELSLDLQTKLLRVLQQREIQPVGCSKAIPIKSRIIAASNRSLQSAVDSGTFRQDLYYHLCALRLRIPPLRERLIDLPELTRFLLGQLKNQNDSGRSLSAGALDVLRAYPWPGNIRELHDCLKRASRIAKGPELQVTDLPAAVRMKPLSQATGTDVFPHDKIVPMPDMERAAIIHALQIVNGDKILAAKQLNIGRTTLYRKIKAYKLIHRGHPDRA
jgi:transcriptional regulator with PAS, ATPase and Fis domain